MKPIFLISTVCITQSEATYCISALLFREFREYTKYTQGLYIIHSIGDTTTKSCLVILMSLVLNYLLGVHFFHSLT